jgi:hypothetical protein
VKIALNVLPFMLNKCEHLGKYKECSYKLRLSLTVVFADIARMPQGKDYPGLSLTPRNVAAALAIDEDEDVRMSEFLSTELSNRLSSPSSSPSSPSSSSSSGSSELPSVPLSDWATSLIKLVKTKQKVVDQCEEKLRRLTQQMESDNEVNVKNESEMKKGEIGAMDAAAVASTNASTSLVEATEMLAAAEAARDAAAAKVFFDDANFMCVALGRAMVHLIWYSWVVSFFWYF